MFQLRAKRAGSTPAQRVTWHNGRARRGLAAERHLEVDVESTLPPSLVAAALLKFCHPI